MQECGAFKEFLIGLSILLTLQELNFVIFESLKQYHEALGV